MLRGNKAKRGIGNAVHGRKPDDRSRNVLPKVHDERSKITFGNRPFKSCLDESRATRLMSLSLACQKNTADTASVCDLKSPRRTLRQTSRFHSRSAKGGRAHSAGARQLYRGPQEIQRR